jgi:small subunit ribosomal protein S5
LSGKIDASSLDLQDRVVTIKRVTKVVKGGRTISFAALVVVGDGNGYVGVGLGKASETAEAIRKGKEDAKKHLIFVQRNQFNSIYHQVTGHFGSANVLLKPAPDGTGVIAGGAVRAVMELAGVKNIITKCIGSSNKRNVVNAAIEGLVSIKTPETVARLRGKQVSEILG